MEQRCVQQHPGREKTLHVFCRQGQGRLTRGQEQYLRPYFATANPSSTCFKARSRSRPVWVTMTPRRSTSFPSKRGNRQTKLCRSFCFLPPPVPPTTAARASDASYKTASPLWRLSTGMESTSTLNLAAINTLLATNRREADKHDKGKTARGSGARSTRQLRAVTRNAAFPFATSPTTEAPTAPLTRAILPSLERMTPFQVANPSSPASCSPRKKRRPGPRRRKRRASGRVVPQTKQLPRVTPARCLEPLMAKPAKRLAAWLSCSEL